AGAATTRGAACSRRPTSRAASGRAGAVRAPGGCRPVDSGRATRPPPPSGIPRGPPLLPPLPGWTAPPGATPSGRLGAHGPAAAVGVPRTVLRLLAGGVGQQAPTRPFNGRAPVLVRADTQGHEEGPEVVRLGARLVERQVGKDLILVVLGERPGRDLAQSLLV